MFRAAHARAGSLTASGAELAKLNVPRLNTVFFEFTANVAFLVLLLNGDGLVCFTLFRRFFER